MMKQQLVWQDMSGAPKDREILVGIKSECDGIIRFDSVEAGFPSSKNTWFWFSDNEIGSIYSNDDLVGWIEVPVLPQAK